jgi:acyl dehydratase
MTRFYEDFEVGATYPTKTRLITDADHEAFCTLVGYDVPLFLDNDYARSRGLPGRICPSHLVMSFSTAMTGELFQGSVIALAGIEGAKFLRHVRPGDSIRTAVEVVQKRLTSKPGQGLVVFRDHVYNQRDEEVFRNDKHALIRCRSGAAA